MIEQIIPVQPWQIIEKESPSGRRKRRDQGSGSKNERRGGNGKKQPVDRSERRLDITI